MFGGMGSGRFISGNNGLRSLWISTIFGGAAGQQAREPSSAVSPHRIDHDDQPGVPDGRQIDQGLQVLNVGGRRIELD